ncbi:MAG: VF530 family protein [Candidatus Peregrinibacteria bacterium]
MQPNNPLHGVPLKKILHDLVDTYGWEYLSTKVHIRCFAFDPSITSSLAFLRKTQWARAKVEGLWIQMGHQ